MTGSAVIDQAYRYSHPPPPCRVHTPAVDSLRRAKRRCRAVSSPLAGIVDAPDPKAVWIDLDIGRQRAVLAELMIVTVLPITRPGPGFDPNTILITPREQQ